MAAQPVAEAVGVAGTVARDCGVQLGQRAAGLCILAEHGVIVGHGLGVVGAVVRT